MNLDPLDPADPVTYELLNSEAQVRTLREVIEGIRVAGITNMGNREGIVQVLHMLDEPEHARQLEEMTPSEWMLWLVTKE